MALCPERRPRPNGIVACSSSWCTELKQEMLNKGAIWTFDLGKAATHTKTHKDTGAQPFKRLYSTSKAEVGLHACESPAVWRRMKLTPTAATPQDT